MPRLHLWFQHRLSWSHRPRPASNLRSALSHPTVIQEYLNNKCAAGHMAGPFPSPPLPNFVVSPLGAVPKKKSGKWQLIMYLSHPPGQQCQQRHRHSKLPPPLLHSLQCHGLRHAPGPRRSDGEAGHQERIPTLPSLPGRPPPARHEIAGTILLHQSTSLWSVVSFLHLHCLAEAIEWIAKQEGVTHIHHYLDDYFLARTPGSAQCAQHLHTHTALCGFLGVPLAEEKLEGLTTCLEYLGILLDSAFLEARLPPDKLLDIH